MKGGKAKEFLDVLFDLKHQEFGSLSPFATSC
jgi:hypothetical protein